MAIRTTFCIAVRQPGGYGWLDGVKGVAAAACLAQWASLTHLLRALLHTALRRACSWSQAFWAAGLLLVWLVTLVPQDALPLTMSASRVVLGLLISVGIGIVAGIVPAVLAANLDPVIAIRAK